MNTEFVQPKLVVNQEMTKQELARRYGVSSSQVAYYVPGMSLDNVKVIYDQTRERAYLLPFLVSGQTANGLNANAVLTTQSGNYDLGQYNAEAGFYQPTPYTFGNAATLNTHNEIFRFGAGRYRWAGTLPKVVPADGTLQSTGGVSKTSWVLVDSEHLVTPHGGKYEDLFDAVHLSEFANRTGWASTEEMFQAACDYTLTTKSKVLNAYGVDLTFGTTRNFDIGNITIMGGVFRGDRDYQLTNTRLENVHFYNGRIRFWGGDVRIFDCIFDGPPRKGQVTTISFQGNPAEGTFEIDGCTFRGGYYGILAQGTGEKVNRFVARNLTFHDMMGDCIELNVVQKHYDDGCVIENIAMFIVDADKAGVNTPTFLSNWGIGIGIAGQGPYGYEIPDSQYCKNFVIRNVYAKGCRQVVHVEVGRNFTVSNIHADPDNTVSTGSGLDTGTVVCFGSKDFVIDGVYGEPVPAAGVSPDAIRVIMLQWGTNQIYQPDGTPFNPPQAAPSNACFNYAVRNVYTKTGQVFAGVSAGPNTPNNASFENIRCKKLNIFGIASHLRMLNVTCNDFACTGQPESGNGAFRDGWFRREASILEMINVNCYPDEMHPIATRPRFERCRYTHITKVGSNVEAEMYTNINGGIGTILGNTGNVYFIQRNDSRGINGTDFPTGREFALGDIIIKEDNSFYLVTMAGAYIPDNDDFAIRATAVGQTTLVHWDTPIGNSRTAPWLYNRQITPGTRIRIPGAGANGGPLDTYVTRAPYQDNDNWLLPVKIDIAHPIQTATGSKVRFTTIPNGNKGDGTYNIGNTIEVRPALPSGGQ